MGLAPTCGGRAVVDMLSKYALFQRSVAKQIHLVTKTVPVWFINRNMCFKTIFEIAVGISKMTLG